MHRAATDALCLFHERRLRRPRWRDHRPWNPVLCAGLRGPAPRSKPAPRPARGARQGTPLQARTVVSAAAPRQGTCPHATNTPQGQDTAVYRRRDPSTTVLYQVVQQNLGDKGRSGTSSAMRFSIISREPPVILKPRVSRRQCSAKRSFEQPPAPMICAAVAQRLPRCEASHASFDQDRPDASDTFAKAHAHQEDARGQPFGIRTLRGAVS